MTLTCPRGLGFGIIACFSFSLFYAPIALKAQNDDFGRNNGISFFYGNDERDLSLASGFDRANVRSTSYGFESIFNDVGLPFGIMVVHRETSVSLYGMEGSRALESSLSTQGSGSYEYQGSIETRKRINLPLNEFWQKAEFPKLPRHGKAIVNLSDREDGGIEVSPAVERAYLEGVKQYLSEHAQRFSYAMPADGIVQHRGQETVTHYERIREGLENFNDQIDIEDLYRCVSGKLAQLEKAVSPEELERFLDDFRTQVLNLGVQYRELAQSYLDHWRDRLENSDYEARFRAQVGFDYEISIGVSQWKVAIENKEDAVYLALPLDLNRDKTKRILVRAGLAEVTNKAEFAIFKIVGRAKASIDLEAELELAENDETAYHELVTHRLEGSVEVPFDLGKNALYLRSPRNKYRLILVGIGYYNRDKTEFFAEIGFRKSEHRGDGIERATLRFSQRLNSWLAGGINFNARQLATHTYFTERNISEDLWRQKEIDKLNNDVAKGRDYFAEAIFGLFLNIGEGTDVKLGEIELLGPNMWFRSSLWANVVSDWHCGLGWEQYRLILPEGISESIPVDHLLEQIPYESARDNISRLNIEAKHIFKDPRVKEDRYSAGLAYRGKRYGIENAIEFSQGEIRAARARACIKRVHVPVFSIVFDLEAGARVDFNYQRDTVKLTSGWFRITPRF